MKFYKYIVHLSNYGVDIYKHGYVIVYDGENVIDIIKSNYSGNFINIEVKETRFIEIKETY